MPIEFGDLLIRPNAAIASLDAVARDGLAPKLAIAEVEKLADSTARAELPAGVAEQINWAVECIRTELNLAGAREHLEKAKAMAQQVLSWRRPHPDDDGIVRQG